MSALVGFLGSVCCQAEIPVGPWVTIGAALHAHVPERIWGPPDLLASPSLAIGCDDRHVNLDCPSAPRLPTQQLRAADWRRRKSAGPAHVAGDLWPPKQMNGTVHPA